MKLNSVQTEQVYRQAYRTIADGRKVDICIQGDGTVGVFKTGLSGKYGIPVLQNVDVSDFGNDWSANPADSNYMTEDEFVKMMIEIGETIEI